MPFYHSNIDYDEVLFYHAGDFFSREGIDRGMVTFHPQGIHHGPQPGAVEARRGQDPHRRDRGDGRHGRPLDADRAARAASSRAATGRAGSQGRMKNDDAANPIGIDGIAFVEYAGRDAEGRASLARLFQALGFSRTRGTASATSTSTPSARSLPASTERRRLRRAHFAEEHGPSIPSMGVVGRRRRAGRRRGRGARRRALRGPSHYGVPAIRGIGGSLIYFVEKQGGPDREALPAARRRPSASRAAASPSSTT